LRPEFFGPGDVAAGFHEHAVAAVVHGAWVSGPDGRRCSLDFQNKEIILLQHFPVGHTALEMRVAFFDGGGRHGGGFAGREVEFLEFVDAPARGIADADDGVQHIGGGDVDDAFPALADHLETVIGGGDHTADEGGREFHDAVPAHGHDVVLALPPGADEHDGPGFQESPDFFDGHVRFSVGAFHVKGFIIETVRRQVGLSEWEFFFHKDGTKREVARLPIS